MPKEYHTRKPLGDFELLQEMLEAIDFKCTSNKSSKNVKIFTKDNVTVIVTESSK